MVKFQFKLQNYNYLIYSHFENKFVLISLFTVFQKKTQKQIKKKPKHKSKKLFKVIDYCDVPCSVSE